MAGRWATAAEAPRRFPRQLPRLRLPCELPDVALSPLSVRAFNFLYYWKHLARQKRGIVHPETFFYPLDAVLDWNKAYGRRGFTQYQVVLPKAEAARTAPAFLDLLTREGGASFLCVIKDCGEEGRGLLSFPMPGISVALDIKITDRTPELVDRLNRFVIAAGGRTYLTKDLFTRAEDYRAMDPRLDQFLAVRRAWDPALRLRSAQSVRLFGDPPREPTSTEAAP
jgi:FAD/FMN-containing dehydrogenase